MRESATSKTEADLIDRYRALFQPDENGVTMTPSDETLRYWVRIDQRRMRNIEEIRHLVANGGIINETLEIDPTTRQTVTVQMAPRGQNVLGINRAHVDYVSEIDNGDGSTSVMMFEAKSLPAPRASARLNTVGFLTRFGSRLPSRINSEELGDYIELVQKARTEGRHVDAWLLAVRGALSMTLHTVELVLRQAWKRKRT